MVIIPQWTSPPPHLAQPHKDAPHGLEVEGLVTVEDEHEASELVTQRLHRLRLAGTCRPERGPTKPRLQSLRGGGGVCVMFGGGVSWHYIT